MWAVWVCVHVYFGGGESWEFLLTKYLLYAGLHVLHQGPKILVPQILYCLGISITLSWNCPLFQHGDCDPWLNTFCMTAYGSHSERYGGLCPRMTGWTWGGSAREKAGFMSIVGIDWRGIQRVEKMQEGKQRTIFISLPIWPQWPEMSRSEATSQELHPGLSHVCRSPRPWAILLYCNRL